MTEKTKKTRKKMKWGRIKVLILLGVLIYAGVTLASLQTKIVAENEKSAALNAERDAQARELEYSENELNYVGSDEYNERQARERFGWLKPGEEKYVEADTSGQSQIPDNSSVPDSSP